MAILKQNYPLHANDEVYLYNTETRQFLSVHTTDHLERLSGRRQPFLRGTTDKAEAMPFRLARCPSTARSSPKIYSNDLVSFYSLAPGMTGRVLEFSSTSARSGATFQQALENGLVHKPRTFLTLGAVDTHIVHSGIFSIWFPAFAVDPLAPVSAYEPVTIMNVTANEPVLYPRDFNLADYVIEPNHPSTDEAPTIYGDYDKVTTSAQWILYPTKYYSVDKCQVPVVQTYVGPSGLDTHENPVFRNAELCREFKIQHRELLPVTGFTRATKGSHVPWWMTGNYALDTRVPTDICYSETTRELPEYASAGACLAAGLPPPPPAPPAPLAPSAPPAPPALGMLGPSDTMVVSLVLGNVILGALVVLVWVGR